MTLVSMIIEILCLVSIVIVFISVKIINNQFNKLSSEAKIMVDITEKLVKELNPEFMCDMLIKNKDNLRELEVKFNAICSRIDQKSNKNFAEILKLKKRK